MPRAPDAKAPPSDDPASKRRAFEADKAAARALDKKKKRVKELEAEIAKGEADLAAMREELKQDHDGDWTKLSKLASREQDLAEQVDSATTEWLTLTEELGGALTDGGRA